MDLIFHAILVISHFLGQTDRVGAKFQEGEKKKKKKL